MKNLLISSLVFILATNLSAQEPSQPLPYAIQEDLAKNHIAIAKHRTTRVYKALDAAKASRTLSNDKQGWLLETDYLNWQVRQRDLDYAVSTNQTSLAIGNGTTKELNFGKSSGIRTTLRYPLNDSWSINFGYTHYTNDASSSLTAADDGVLLATRSHPKFNEEASTASATSTRSHDTFRLELSRPMIISDQATFTVFGGFNWGENDQAFNIDYQGRDFVDGIVENYTSVKSFGLHLGAEGTWNISDNFFAFGTGVGSIMNGDYSLVQNESEFNTHTQTRDTIVQVSDSYEQSLPSFAASLGVGWTTNRADIRIGYEMQAWLDLSDRTVFLDDTHEGVYSKGNHNVMFDGFFVRAAFNF